MQHYTTRISGKLVREWEKKLTPYGLALNQLRTQWLQYVTDFGDAGFQHYQFDRELNGFWKWRNRNQLPWANYDGFDLIPTHASHRTSPEWARNLETLRTYLLHRYPHLKNGQRKIAARVAAILYLAFVVGLSSSEIADFLGGTPGSVQVRISLERARGDKFFATKAGT